VPHMDFAKQGGKSANVHHHGEGWESAVQTMEGEKRARKNIEKRKKQQGKREGRMSRERFQTLARSG